MVSRTRRIAVASLFGVIIFAIRGFIPAPTADFLIGIEAFLLAITVLIVGRFGATYVEVVNGLILTPVKLSFAPFSLLLALLFGVQVDVFSLLLRPKQGNEVRTGRLVAVMTIATATTGVISYYSTAVLTRIVPNDIVLDVTILAYGVVSGAVGGFLGAKVWKKNLRARFQSMV